MAVPAFPFSCFICISRENERLSITLVSIPVTLNIEIVCMRKWAFIDNNYENSSCIHFYRLCFFLSTMFNEADFRYIMLFMLFLCSECLKIAGRCYYWYKERTRISYNPRLKEFREYSKESVNIGTNVLSFV